MFKRKSFFVTLFVWCTFSSAQEKIDLNQLPDWIWGEYVYSNGNWPMDLHKDFIVFSGKLSGYVTDAEVEDEVYCLTVTDFNPKKPQKKAWLKLVGVDTISISFDKKRFGTLTKPSENMFKRVDLQEYLKPIKGIWYNADTGIEYADFGENFVMLDGVKYEYDYVVKNGKTTQLNLSGKPYGRFIHLNIYTDLYIKIKASGLSSRVCKRKPEMPKQVSNLFSDVPENLTGTFYTTDGKNTKLSLTPYQVTLGQDTFPLKKLRIKDEGVKLTFKLYKITTDVLLTEYNENYIFYKKGSDLPVFMKRNEALPDGIAMSNPFVGEWYSTLDASTLKLDEVSFVGSGIGKGKFDQVLFTGETYDFFKKGTVVASAKKFGEDYVELSTKKGVVLYKAEKHQANYVNLDALPKHYIQSWYSDKGDFEYGILGKYVAYKKRFYTVDSIIYQKQKYQLGISYTDTVCYYNKNNEYVCEIVNDHKTLSLNQSDKNTIEIKGEATMQNAALYTNKVHKVEPAQIEMKYNGKAVLLGYVANSHTMKSKSLTLYHKDVLYNKQQKFTSTVDSQGFFKFEIPLLNTKAVWIKFGSNNELILTPNDTVLVCTDAYKIKSVERWNIMGPNVALNKEISPLYYESLKITRNRYKKKEKEYNNSPERYAQFSDSIYADDLLWLENYVKKNNTSIVVADYWKKRVTINYWDDLMRYAWMRERRGGQVRLTDHPTYFAFLDSIQFADPNLWLHHGYQEIVHETHMRNNRITRGVVDGFELFAVIAEKDTTLTEENKLLLTDMTKLIKPSKAVKDTVNAILTRNKSLIAKLKQEKIATSANSITDTENGLVLTDVFACSDYYRSLEGGKDIEKGWEELTIKVADESFLRHMKISYEKELAIEKRELPEYCLMNYPAKTSGDKFLKTLAEKHAGYVVYIDVWAPWCSPCRREMEYAPALKKAMKEQPVHFVYLCGSGGKEAQENCIKKYDIAGDHYYLESETYEEITGKFNITGIPTFMIMDKDGNIVNQKAPRPSSKTTIIDTLKRYAEQELGKVVSVKE